MHIASIGIDLGKTTCHLVALGDHNKILLWKKSSPAQMFAHTGNVQAVQQLLGDAGVMPER